MADSGSRPDHRWTPDRRQFLRVMRVAGMGFVSPTAEKVVSTGVPTELIRGDVFFWQSLQAATVLVAVPIALVFNLFLDKFVAGFTAGAVKG